MPISNPFRKNDANAEAGAGDGSGAGAVAEKTPAELIAESMRTGLAPLMDAINDMKGRQDRIEAKLQPKPAESTEQPQRTSVFEDEDRAIGERVAPVLKMQLEMEARYERDRIFQEYRETGYGETVKACAEEINNLLDGSPLVGADGKKMRGSTQYIKNVIDMVFGRRAREAGVQFGGRERGFFVESASGSSELGNGAASETAGLSDSQLKLARKLGIPPKDLKGTMSKLTFVN